MFQRPLPTRAHAFNAVLATLVTSCEWRTSPGTIPVEVSPMVGVQLLASCTE